MTQTTVAPAEGIVTKPSPYSVAETLSRLTKLIDNRGLTLFAVIDHSGEAARAGLQMPDTKLVIFGSPAAGTPVMLAAPLAALDLPLRILVWSDHQGAVSVSYNSPSYLAARYHFSNDLTARISPVDAISDATVTPEP